MPDQETCSQEEVVHNLVEQLNEAKELNNELVTGLQDIHDTLLPKGE